MKEAACQLSVPNSNERAVLKLRVEFDHILSIALEADKLNIPFGVFEQPKDAFEAAFTRPVMVMGKNGYLSLKPSNSELIVRYDGKEASVLGKMPMSAFRKFVAEVTN